MQPKSPSIPKSETMSPSGVCPGCTLPWPSLTPTTLPQLPGSPTPGWSTGLPAAVWPRDVSSSLSPAGSGRREFLLIVPVRMCCGSCVIPFLAKNPHFASPHTVLPAAASTGETVYTTAGFANVLFAIDGRPLSPTSFCKQLYSTLHTHVTESRINSHKLQKRNRPPIPARNPEPVAEPTSP